MPDILHDFPIAAPADRVLAAVNTPAGLEGWWTLTSSGEPVEGAVWLLDFGPGYRWRARVSRRDERVFELEMIEATTDWIGTTVRFELDPIDAQHTSVRFGHAGWREVSGHYRTSSYCWAMYLRLLRRLVESGEVVPYARRLDA